MSPLRIGVIGLGAISRFYLAAVQRLPSLLLAAVCDRDPDALVPLHETARCYLDHRELLSAGGLDAVVVAAPNHMHAPLCRDVLAAGLPVCVEKPLATLTADGAALRAEAELRGVTLFTAFHRRYNRAVRALAARLPADVPIASLTVRYLERIEDHIGDDAWYLDPARCGGGCVADNGPNAFDLARLLLGEVTVARADIVRDSAGADRQAVVRLRAERGATVVVELDWSYPGERKEAQVELADGRVETADMLSGYSGFKESLWHEYTGVLKDFERRVRGTGTAWTDDAGPSALALVRDTYLAESHGRAAKSPAPLGDTAGAEGGRR